MSTRICNRCKTELPLTGEFFSRCKQDKKGFKYWCKKCNREVDKIRREKNLPPQTLRIREEATTGLRTCTTCGEAKTLTTEFTKVKCPKGERYYLRECKTCRQFKRNGGRASKRKTSKSQTLLARNGRYYKCCAICDTEQPLENFSKAKIQKTGYKRECKTCSSALSSLGGKLSCIPTPLFEAKMLQLQIKRLVKKHEDC